VVKTLFKYNFHVLLVYLLLAFPLFYFVYKFGILLMGYDDAKSYFKLFSDLGSPEVPSPFNMRLLSSSIIHCIEKTGIVYNTECAIDAFPVIDKRYFFANLFFNFICITLTCFSVFLVCVKHGFGKVLSFLAGALYLLGFGTIFFLMMPGVDALSVLIFTWIVHFYLKKSYWLIPLFAALIFQREYYFLAFMVIALMDFLKDRQTKYYLHVLLLAVASFGAYFVLRKTFFHTDHWSNQTSPAFLLNSLFTIKIQVGSMIRQTLMTMNIYLIYIFVLLYKKHKGMPVNKHYLYVTLALLVEITILSFAATFGNNNGRYFYLNTPLFLYYIMYEINPLLQARNAEALKQ
jgi:hypothetical protein